MKKFEGERLIRGDQQVKKRILILAAGLSLFVVNARAVELTVQDCVTMALENTRQRLAGFFAEGASMNQARVDGGYQVRIAFPYPGERP